MKDKTARKPCVALIDRTQTALRQMAQLVAEARDCELALYDNARDALIGIGRQRPDLIVSEWSLTDLNASDLLTALASHADLRRIPVLICTAQSGAEVAATARGLGARGVLSKPPSRRQLRQWLDELLPSLSHNAEIAAARESFMNGDLRTQLKYIDKLAPLPVLVKTIMEVSADPNSSARNLAEVVKMDQSLTAKILQIVNSAYYGFYRQIGNIDHAIVILGFNEVTNISLAACLIQAYRDGPNPYMDREQFWVHTLGAAYIARALRIYTPDVITKDAFVIGLLHDIGKVVLDQHFKPAFLEVLKESHSRQSPLHRVEHELLTIDHAEIGGLVAESWNLPVPLTEAIQFHHQPELHIGEYAVHLAHLANWFAHRHQIGQSGNPAPGEPAADSLRIFGFEGKDLDEVWKSLNIDAQALRKIL